MDEFTPTDLTTASIEVLAQWLGNAVKLGDRDRQRGLTAVNTSPIVLQAAFAQRGILMLPLQAVLLWQAYSYGFLHHWLVLANQERDHEESDPSVDR